VQIFRPTVSYQHHSAHLTSDCLDMIIDMRDQNVRAILKTVD